MFEEIKESPDRDEIQKVIRKLIEETYLLKTKYNPETGLYKDDPLYLVLQRYENQIRDFLEILGLELKNDVQFGIYYLSGESVRPIRMSEADTRILLVLKLLHQEKMTEDGLLEPITDFLELREKGATIGLITEKIKESDLRKSLRFFTRHNIISISDNMKDFNDRTKIYIYHTVHLLCPNYILEAVLKEYAEMEQLVAEDETADASAESVEDEE